VRGIDLELRYARPVTLLGGGDERLSLLRGFASWLLERSETNSSGIKTDYAGQTGATQNSQSYLPYADFKAVGSLTYRNGGTAAMVQARYIGAGIQDATLTEGVHIVDNSVSSALYVDLRFSQAIAAGRNDAELWFAVTNLFDKNPPLTPSWSASGGFATQTNAAVYDRLGRQFTIGASLKF
jgi:iron complex outermembrane receptor protein